MCSTGYIIIINMQGLRGMYARTNQCDVTVYCISKINGIKGYSTSPTTVPAGDPAMPAMLLSITFGGILKNVFTLSRATEQYCAAGAILKPLCLSKQLTLL